MLGKPSLLLVAQPDDSLPGVNGEVKVIQAFKAQVTATGRVSSEATPSSVVEGLRGGQLHIPRSAGGGKAIRGFIQPSRGLASHAARHCTFSTSGCRIHIPFLLSRC